MAATSTPTYLAALQQARSSLTQQQGVTDATQRAQTLLQAKSGKQLGTDALAPSNIEEQQAVEQANTQIKQDVAPQLNLQSQNEATAAEATVQQGKAETLQAGQAQQYTNLKAKTQLADMLQSLQQSKGQVQTQEQTQSLEQASFLMSMQDRNYVQQLQQVGQVRNLSNKMNFLGQMQDVVFGASSELVKQQLGQQNILAMSKRDFSTAMAQMSIDDAVKVANLETSGRQAAFSIEAGQMQYAAGHEAAMRNIGSMGQGVSGIVSGGAQAYGTYQNQQDRQSQQAYQQQAQQAQQDNQTKLNSILGSLPGPTPQPQE